MATVPVRAPFRLDLTANALRRLSTNVVDTYSAQDGFIRAHRGALIVVRQLKRDSPLDVRTLGAADFDAAALIARMLGTDRELRPFYRGVKAFPWLDALATRMRGIKPPRYPTLWEAIVNAVVFQQVSIHAASAILRRVVEHLSKPIEHQGRKLYPFFEPEAYLDADSEALRKQGLSGGKAVTLRANAEALVNGALREAELEPLPTGEVMGRLMTMKGIGPWTAAVICLRGLGRLDVFPMEDSGATRSLKELSGDESVDLNAILDALGEQRGMLYYHLLLGRLESRGQLEEQRTAPPPPPPRLVQPRPPRRPPRRPGQKPRRGPKR
ncbi:MAG: DNA-3-methyladenine glycosylase 2 family protein [Candidatus Eremiobacteraeota bacterium]|nr:DNA-3-methyladenine glycosylase 2 family protein [Candidatus Eremiobacteraeota bacterium]